MAIRQGQAGARLTVLPTYTGTITRPEPNCMFRGRACYLSSLCISKPEIIRLKEINASTTLFFLLLPRSPGPNAHCIGSSSSPSPNFSTPLPLGLLRPRFRADHDYLSQQPQQIRQHGSLYRNFPLGGDTWSRSSCRGFCQGHRDPDSLPAS